MPECVANNKTLHKAIERCEKRLIRLKDKLRWSVDEKDRIAAREAIAGNDSKILILRQQIILNTAQRA